MPGKRLEFQERVRIEAWWKAGWSKKQIAEALGRHPSTVGRELREYNSYRHGPKNPNGKVLATRLHDTYQWGYDAQSAQKKASGAAKRPKPIKFGQGLLRTLVVAKLKQRWSPEQIAAWLRTQHPDRPEWHVSHETIYQAIYVQSRGHLRAELSRQVALRTGRAGRRPQRQAAGAVRSRRLWTVDLLISERPAEVEDRAVPGHWEGDLVIGTGGHSAIVTLVERSTRFVMLGALPNSRVSEEVIAVLTTLMGRVPAELARTLTWDQGNEMAQHATFTLATGVKVYFATPHSPWLRGSNENTNGLLRQYFPKGDFDFHTIDQAGLDAVAAELNSRPRKTLAWQTPAEALNTALLATAA